MKTQLTVLMAYLVLFGAITILGIVDLFRNIQLVDIGLPTRITNVIIVVLGMAGLIKSAVYLYLFEHKTK